MDDAVSLRLTRPLAVPPGAIDAVGVLAPALDGTFLVGPAVDAEIPGARFIVLLAADATADAGGLAGVFERGAEAANEAADGCAEPSYTMSR